jgi:hypothetical protein
MAQGLGGDLKRMSMDVQDPNSMRADVGVAADLRAWTIMTTITTTRKRGGSG